LTKQVRIRKRRRRRRRRRFQRKSGLKKTPMMRRWTRARESKERGRGHFPFGKQQLRRRQRLNPKQRKERGTCRSRLSWRRRKRKQTSQLRCPMVRGKRCSSRLKPMRILEIRLIQMKSRQKQRQKVKGRYR
jgi:hypothetical protein